MQNNNNKSFKDERINLDFSEYENCTFEECEIHLEYGITRVVNNDFEKCTLHLHGPALNVAQIIKLFYPESFPIIINNKEESSA